MRSTGRLLLLALAAVPALAAPSPAAAADITFTVNTTEDGADANPGDGICATSGGECTLRAAVMESNHTASGTVEIVVPASGQAYVLSILPTTYGDEERGDLNIGRAVTISGGGAARTIVDGNGTGRVFTVGIIPFSGTGPVVLSGLTIRNGLATNSGPASSGYGGGFLGTPAITYTISRCVIASNTADIGAGIAVQGTLILDRSTVSGNVATVSYGGGVYAPGQPPTIGASTISGNAAKLAGGGVYANGGTIFYSTIAGNTAQASGVTSASGGGVYNGGGTFTVTGSILSDNRAVLATDPPTLYFSDCFGTFEGGTNLVGTTTDCTITASVGDPLLGPLQLNGGDVPTRAIPKGSPAFDAGNPFACAFDGASGDGRLAFRPQGAACDLGAYEVDANGDVNGDGSRDVADVFTLINFLFAGGPAPVGLGDVNGDGKTDVADVFYLINFLFAGGPAPL